jgi:hypothetical protein
MTRTNTDWTHKGIKIVDIRKLAKLYVIRVQDLLTAIQIESPLFVKDNIFEERLKAYFLKEMSQISRYEILPLSWNMYITKGYYIKINERGDVDKFPHDPEKWYVSYLEIDGPLGTFYSVYRDKE